MHDIGFEHHDHAACVADALQTAETCCAERKVQLTPVRRRTLEILLQEHRALGAYDILGQLAEEGLGSQPPVAYRALDFLQSQGFVHKIERLNAWFACTHSGQSHSPIFLICRNCNQVVESTLPGEGLRQAAKDAGFQIETTVVEAEGLCPTCQEAA